MKKPKRQTRRTQRRAAYARSKAAHDATMARIFERSRLFGGQTAALIFGDGVIDDGSETP